jgi:hypothetical protein
MAKVMFSLPDQLVARMKSAIPSGQRSELFAKLLEKEVESREANLYTRALELESHKGLHNEMSVWDAEFGGDGLNDI